jgi:hypothetical protein
MRGLAKPLQVIPRDPAELVDCLRCTGLQGARNRRLLGTVRPPKGPLHGGIHANRHVTLGDGLAPQRIPHSPSSTLSIGR